MTSSKQPATTSSTQTSTPLTTNLDYISRTKESLYTHLSTRRPWRQVLDPHTLTIPPNLPSAYGRLKSNLSYFRINFVFFVLLILFLSLIWHPLSLIVFLLMSIAWIFLYLFRDHPLVILGRDIDDRIVLALLSFLTLLFLFFTGATLEIIISVSVSVAVVLVYSVFRSTEDLYVGEDDASTLVTNV